MFDKVLIDVCVPREVSKRLEDLGFETIYLTELFSWDVEDEKIFKWMQENEIPILTRDKDFPENGGSLKITLEGESSVKLTRQALSKLLEERVYPKALAGSWKETEEIVEA